MRRPDPLPELHDFTLTAFGLPEPVGVVWPKRTNHGWVWVALAGVGCIAVAVGFAVLKRRAVRHTPPLASAPPTT